MRLSTTMSSVSEIGRLGCALRDLCDAAPDGDAVGLANIGKSETHRHDDIQGLLRFEPHRKPFDPWPAWRQQGPGRR